MIRLATWEDLNTIMEIYAIARKYMAENGNPTQWADTYPDREILRKDIESEQLFVCTKNDMVHGVFAFMIGPEATYSYLENGSWKNENIYGTIHRVASDGVGKGVCSGNVLISVKKGYRTYGSIPIRITIRCSI